MASSALSAFGRMRMLQAIKRPKLDNILSTITQTQKQETISAIKSPPLVEPEVINPLDHVDFFEVAKMFTVKDLFDARVHWGHREGTLDDRMRPFIFGNRLGQLIFDLDQTAFHLRAALNFTGHIAFRKGIVLFVMRYRHGRFIVEETAKECGEYAHTRFWRGGVLTNINARFGSITRLPDLVLLIGSTNTILEMHTAVRDAAKMLIPTVGIVDTNCNPNLITYPVPGNDDTPCAIELYCRLFKEVILKAKRMRKDLEDRGVTIKE